MALRLDGVLCWVALVQLLCVQILAEPLKEAPIRLSVVSDVSNEAPQVYHSSALQRGSLLGALRRLQDTNSDFKFTVTENPDYGYYLESVNGVAGSESDFTYWQILTDVHGSPTLIDVGLGCYTPKPYEHITLKLTTW
ncbi:transcobalamin beta a [Sardina pilchardus]|uniref:transcobalamin beta a n=1 Tax=Sardina pilchardus TaxID=27697 RepID=UPI002E1156D2